MEDTITPDISIALYRYLCQNITGSEDYVKRIRFMNAVKDTMSTTQKIPTITSGSFGEGLEMRGSDLDIMCVRKDVEVYENVKPRFNPNISYLSMERDDVKPGFTQLRIDDRRSQNVLQSCKEHNVKLYVSSTLYKERFLQDNVNTIHGPCISNRNGSFDAAMCFRCKTWVSPAVQWIIRSNNSWPTHKVKQSIIEHGVLFVPIGVKGSPKEDLEWRISFSVGETFLINTFAHTQLLCYALLKIIFKDVIVTFSECKDFLCSYFMKTIIFWISEELPIFIWKPGNIIPCFMRCFRRLIYCVEHSVCLHYFIPENNMFENRIEGRARETLLEKLYMLCSFGWRCILFSDQVSSFDVSKLKTPIDPHILYVKEIEKMMKSRLFQWANVTFPFPESKLFNRGIIPTVSFQ